MANPTDETQQIRAARQGDHVAVAHVMERFRSLATATAHLALRNADDAQDVAQEALIYALFHLHECHEDHKFGAWLRQITLSACADYRRRRGTRRLGEPIALLNEASEEERFAERLDVKARLADLSEAHRTTLLLHHVGGWSIEETATLLAIPVNTVRSRLMAAKKRLRPSWGTTTERKTMTVPTLTLNEADTNFLDHAFPSARVLSLEENPEPWMPFAPRVRLALSDGSEATVDFRGDLTPETVRLLAALERAGIPGPKVIRGPVPDGRGGWRCLSAPPAGENVLLWALGGTPLRLRLATERAFEAIDRLQGATEALLADDAGAALARRTLADEAEAIVAAGGPWLDDPWFQAALKATRAAAREIHDPLVYTHYLHFFPNFVRIAPETGLDGDGAFGWPGDPRNQANPLVEFVSPFGHLGDPLLGLAMVWVYDCYPFVHTGFVEQFLWRRNRSRREFAPRLAIKALQTLQRETLPGERSAYASALRGWIDHARQDL